MGLFGNKSPRVRVIKETAASRVLDLSDFIEDKYSAKLYESEFAHIAPNRIEFMQRVHLWEAVYIPFREAQGWILSRGGRNSDDRFKITWKVGDQQILAVQDDWNGLVTEKVKNR